MRLDATLYRVVEVPLEHLMAAAGLRGGRHWSEVEGELRKRFGILAPRFRMFVWDGSMGNEKASPVVTCGIEVMRFSLKDSNHPQAGIVTADPVSERAIHMADGALGSELERMGIEIDPTRIEWRMGYVVTGN